MMAFRTTIIVPRKTHGKEVRKNNPRTLWL